MARPDHVRPKSSLLMTPHLQDVKNMYYKMMHPCFASDLEKKKLPNKKAVSMQLNDS